MARFTKILQFMGWPTVSGILLALVILQYQQLQLLSEQRLSIPQYQPPAPPQISFADAIKMAAPSVVSINATSVNVESIERESNHWRVLLAIVRPRGLYADWIFVVVILRVR